MRSGVDRAKKYTAKYVAGTVGLKIAARLPGMKTGYSAAVQSLVPIEIAIQGILNALSVQTTSYPFYINFGREMWSKQWKGIEGGALVAAATTTAAKYVSYGLTKSTLQKIALDCFSIIIP
jgi:hypothetical protein